MSPDTTYSGPYARAVQIYRQAGWHGTLPLGDHPGVKYPPPKGWTGHGAPYPSAADVAAWAETHGDRNIGLRMPPGVIGLDVDDYKDKTGAATLAELEQRFGPLPPTWVSSARPAPSGIRFYRVPSELDGRPVNWPGEAGKFIEIIQPGHRYAVVWPSTNPEAAGAEYEWRFQHRTETREWLGEPVVYPPKPESLAELPDVWVRGLALPYERVDKANLGSQQYADFWAALRPGGPPCEVVHSVWTRAVDTLRSEAASRHETARDAVRALVALGGEGHRGVPAAAEDMSRVFTEAVGPERIANGEWHRLLAGAIELAAAKTPDPHQHCEHDAATVIEAPPDFSMPAATSSLLAAGRAPDLDSILTEVRELPHDALIERLTAYAGTAHALSRPERECWRTAFKELGLPYAQFDRLLKAAVAEQQAARAERMRAELAEKGGRELSSHVNPMAVARELLKDLPATDGIAHLGHWRGDFYTYTGTHWEILDEAEVRSWIYRETEHAWFPAGTDDEPGKTERWLPNSRKVSSVADALGTGVLHRRSADEHEPCIALTNGVYDLAADALMPHSPARWNLNALPFAYDPTATCPQWLAFLAQVLPADSITFLQEWMGYLVSGRTNQQKIASLIGLPRSGKGTINRVITAMIGQHNVAGPTLGSLVNPFGLEPLLGRSLATFADVKWTAKGVGDATELLKTISGEDAVTVHRKHKVSWEGRLPTRFMLMSNDTPSFTDASGALGNRLIHLRFNRSFLGKEDPHLSDRLLTELPGVFLWALEGLRRLDERGRFHVPAASAEVDTDVRRTASPHLVFVEERCTLDSSARITLDALWAAWAAWCADDGAEEGNKRWFVRKLKSVLPEIDTYREDTTLGRTKWVLGLRLADNPFPIHVPQL